MTKTISLAALASQLRAPLSKSIQQSAVESWSAALWQAASEIKPKTKHDATPRGKQQFTMMFPPPNITGNLHLGHALTAAVQDALVRQRRMAGHETTWIPGFDHAGLATQSIVEKILWHQRGLTRQQVGRSEFVKLAHQWKETKLNEMRTQLSRLGLALDHDKEYFTMDERSSYSVQRAFRNLFEGGLIYRAAKDVYWSEQLQTTLSDIEVEDERYVRTGELVGRKSINQWFVDMRAMSHRAVEVVKNESLQILPANYKNSWSNWLVDTGVEDWCISRQSWWGHEIPAFRLKSSADVQESWIVADSLEDASRRFNSNPDDVMRDPDVLDTWFSSSLLPLTISGWPDKQEFGASIARGTFPLHLMETGFDILTFWVSKMVMMGLSLENKIPFKTVLLHGMICDSNGKKMSKSLGNIIDPLDVIDGVKLSEFHAKSDKLHAGGFLNDKQLEVVKQNQRDLFPKGIPECGADGLRAYLLSLDVQEEIVPIQMDQLEKVRRFANKLWNVYRFILPTVGSLRDGGIDFAIDINLRTIERSSLDEGDLQILTKLHACLKEHSQSFSATYSLHLSYNSLEWFVTKDLSLDYIGKFKNCLLANDSQNQLDLRKFQLVMKCLVTATKALHPFMPHITEFLYQKLRSTAGLDGPVFNEKLLVNEKIDFDECDHIVDQ